jgi:hypothetical protein
MAEAKAIIKEPSINATDTERSTALSTVTLIFDEEMRILVSTEFADKFDSLLNGFYQNHISPQLLQQIGTECTMLLIDYKDKGELFLKDEFDLLPKGTNYYLLQPDLNFESY